MKILVPRARVKMALLFSLLLASDMCSIASGATPTSDILSAPTWLVICKHNPFIKESVLSGPLSVNGFAEHETRKSTLWWTKVPGAMGYNVYRGTSSNKELSTPIAKNVTSLTYVDNGLKDSTTYYYEVTARNATDESPRSLEAHATTKAPPTLSIAPATPCPWMGGSIIRNAAWLSVNASSEDSSLSYFWSSKDAATDNVKIIQSKSRLESAANNRVEVQFSKAGTYAFAVKVTDADGLASNAETSVTVGSIPSSITVMPETITLHPNETCNFKALVRDQFGWTIVSPPKLAWSVPLGDATIDSAKGVFTAPKFRPGPTDWQTMVTAAGMDGATKGTATVTFHDRGPILVQPVSITQVSTGPSPGSTAQLSVLAKHDAGDNAILYRWAITKSPPGSSQNLDPWSRTPSYWVIKDGDYSFEVTISDRNRVSITSSIDAVARNGVLVAVKAAVSAH